MKRHYYHISLHFIENLVLEPRSSHHPECSRDVGEPSIARICVAPSVAHCMSAIAMYSKVLYIYRTKHRVLGTQPYKVSDAKLTRERWLLRPTEFVLAGKIGHRKMSQFLSEWDQFQYDDHYWSMAIQRRFLKFTKIFLDDENLTFPAEKLELVA